MARANGSTKGRMHDSFMINRIKQEDPRYHLDKDRPVGVYRNLHRNCYSVKQDGLVKAHADELMLNNCTFHVNANGRKRVRETKRKEVHAWIKGFLSDIMPVDPPKWFDQVFYNPYKNDTFMHRVEVGAMSATFCEIVQASAVTLTPDGVYKS